MQNVPWEDIAHKTRVIFYNSESSETLAKFLYILDFLGQKVNVISSNQNSFSPDNDFVIIEWNETLNLQNHLQPNVVLIENFSDETKIENFIKTVTSGGAVIYNPNVERLQNIITQSENYFRKLPIEPTQYEVSENTILLETDFGTIPLNIPENEIAQIEGLRLMAQQFGIMEEDFYDALVGLM